MEDQLIDHGIAGILRRPLQIVPHPFRVSTMTQPLALIHWSSSDFKFGLLYRSSNSSMVKKMGWWRADFQHPEKFFVRQLSAQKGERRNRCRQIHEGILPARF